MNITKEQARLFLLCYQQLLHVKNGNKEDIYSFIKKVGSIQFDPLNVIDTNPQLVLQSRFSGYKRDFLNELLYKDRLLIDDWDKNLCIYPVSDWPYFTLYREKGFRTFGKEDLSNSPLVDEVKEIIKEKGPISSNDLDMNEKVNWFWNHTRLSRVILESMYLWGELVIHHKDKGRKYYDITSHVLPKEIIEQAQDKPTLEAFFRFIVKRRIGSVGLLWNRHSDAWLGIYFMKSKDRNEAIKQLLASNEIIEIFIEGIDYPFYLRSCEQLLLEEVINEINYEKKVSFIAPLDNLLWDRKIIKELFNFEYTWEVYKPSTTREYGYYVLPVLYGDQFIARFEPRFIKKTKQLEILNWWWEEGIVVTKDMKTAIMDALERMKNYLGANGCVIKCEIKW